MSKSRLPNQVKCGNFKIKRLFLEKDTLLLNELLLLYKKNNSHLYFWHKDEPKLQFKNITEYKNYLNSGKLFCYAIVLNERIAGCIELSYLSTDYISQKYRFITFWLDK